MDKTKFIKEWWENQDDMTLIACARRFGQTGALLAIVFKNKYNKHCIGIFERIEAWRYYI